MLHRVILLTAFLSFFSQVIFSQSSWQPGFVVQNSGDTLRVEIQKSNKLDLIVSYRQNSSATSVNVNPEQIRSFGWNKGLTYVSIPSTPAFSNPRFYQLLIGGKAELLMIRKRFIARMKDTVYFELKNETVRDTLTGETHESNSFQRLLTYHFKDCEQVTKQIQNTSLYASSLIKLFERYNSCFGDAPIGTNSNKKRIEVGVFGGSIMQKLNYIQNAPDEEYLTGANPTSQTNGIGGFLNYSIGPKMVMVLDVYYFKTITNFTTDMQNDAFQEHNVFSTDDSNLQANLLFHYSFRNKGLIPYLILGISSSFALSENSLRSQTLTLPSFGVVYSTTYVNFISMGFSLGGSGGLGIRFQNNSRFSPFVEARYSVLAGNGTVSNNNTKTPSAIVTHRNISLNRETVFVIGGISYRLSRY